jgi:hypothetical protein
MNRVAYLLTAILAGALSGCGSLKFYPDPAMKQDEVGLKGYYPKPYVLVARDGTSKVTSVTLVYLPDLEHPVYAQARSGYGSSNLTLSFTNGVITNFGQQTDSKVPETLTALGGLDTAIATAAKTRAETAVLQKQSGDFGKYSDQLKTIASDLRGIVKSDKGHVLSTSQGEQLQLNANSLDGGPEGTKQGLAAAFAAPGAAANADALIKALTAISKSVGAIKPASDQLSEDAKKVWEKLAGLQAALANIIDDLKPKLPDPPALSLFEILMEGGKTRLREVPLGTSAQ